MEKSSLLPEENTIVSKGVWEIVPRSITGRVVVVIMALVAFLFGGSQAFYSFALAFVFFTLFKNKENLTIILGEIETFFSTLSLFRWAFFVLIALSIEVFFMSKMYFSPGECSLLTGHFNGLCLLLVLSPEAWVLSIVTFATLVLPLLFIFIITKKFFKKSEVIETP